MKSYITILDDMIPANLCTKLIDKFERNEVHEQKLTTWENRRFLEVNITEHWQQEHDVFVNMIQQAWRKYADIHNVQIGSQWPDRFGYEQFRMKRYLPNQQDQFYYHTDVGNYGSARRFLSFLWYLNTVEEGGRTCFGYMPNSEVFNVVQAVQGRLLMFPPLWTYPHWGEKTISGPKYIVSGYLHYL